MNKSCIDCRKLLPLELFGKRSSNSDGLSSRCKDCERAKRIAAGKQKPLGWVRKTADKAVYRRAYAAANREKLREYEKNRKRPYDPDRERKKYESRMKRLHGDDYVVGDPKNKLRGNEAVQAAAKARKQTRKNTRRAVKRGKLEKLPCQVCGALEVEAHHHDYSKPLEVTWLCSRHHKELHDAAKPVLP